MVMKIISTLVLIFLVMGMRALIVKQIKSHQYTGLTIHIPNSLFLANTIKNETNLWSDYVYHLILRAVRYSAAEEWARLATVT